MAAAQITDETSAVTAFITSMIWGYGPVGYGAYRTSRVLRLNHGHAPGRLLAAAIAARDRGPEAAFMAMATAPLSHLGPAFGTKYIYFCTRAVADRHNGRTAPVLDDVVRRWFAAQASVRLTNSWSVPNYEKFLGYLESWGHELELRMDETEEIIFGLQVARDDNRHWVEDWAVESAGIGEAVDAITKLRAAVEMLGGSAAADASPHLDTRKRSSLRISDH